MKFSEDKVPYIIPEPNNMGFVRYILAFAVLFAHFNFLMDFDFPFPITSYTGVGGFFALSGFLIYGSFLRHPRLKDYIISRAKRILPAYFTAVLLFALFLAVISTLSPAQYFLSKGLWKYLAANITFLNFIEPSLPGVFADATENAVNGSLWTMKIEWMLYLSVPLAAWLVRKLKCSHTLLFIIIYSFSVCYRIGFLYLYELTGNEIYNILGRQIIGQLCYFYCGVTIYFHFSSFRKWKWQLLAFAIMAVLLEDFIPYYEIILHPIVIAILTLWFSMFGQYATWSGRRDNISYNIYLIHYPIIQLVRHYDISETLSIWGALGVSVAATVAVSLLINRCIERPLWHYWHRK